MEKACRRDLTQGSLRSRPGFRVNGPAPAASWLQQPAAVGCFATQRDRGELACAAVTAGLSTVAADRHPELRWRRISRTWPWPRAGVAAALLAAGCPPPAALGWVLFVFWVSGRAVADAGGG